MVPPAVRVFFAFMVAWAGGWAWGSAAEPGSAYADPKSSAAVEATPGPSAPGGSVVIQGPGGSHRVIMPGGPGTPPGAQPPAVPPGTPGGAPGKSGEPGKPEEKKSTEGVKPEEPPPLKRPAAPPTPPDPSELKVRPDHQGKVSFNFKGQPWPAVLEWLADISGMSLDWQELPGDYLNLTTPRPYTLREARDLINRHLLARGFTMLTLGDTLSVVNCKKLNSALVPRIEPDELADHDPYEFVKVSFPLDSLVAEEAAEEFKPMLSPNGRLVPLRGTNRLEAIDAVINLREMYALLVGEQSGLGSKGFPREFELRYAKASEVVEQLQALLGIESKAPRARLPSSGPMPPGLPPEVQRQMMMAGQPMPPGGPQPGQQPGQPQQPGSPTKPKIEVSLIANTRKNSVLAIAPADKMAIIAQAIKTLDVPTQQGSPLAGTLTRMQIYRLAAIDPEPFVKTLEEIGNLDPNTRLQVDKTNRAIIAYAPLADHVTIRSLIEKLDGSERQFEVIQLRRLEADDVAGSIEFMMTGEKPKQSRRPPWYYDFDSRSRTQEQEKDKFRVDADVENNRLLLWANPIELEEVRKLLVKLGEIPSEGGNPATVRVLDLPPGKEADALIERLRRHWPSVAPNPLVLPPREPKTEPTPPKTPQERPPEPPPRSPANKTVAFMHVGSGASGASEPESPNRSAEAERANQPTQPVAESASSSAAGPVGAEFKPPAASIAPKPLPSDVSRPSSGSPPSAPPPVTFSRGPDGHWIVSSPDTQALDRLEQLLAQLSAAERVDYRIFHLQYAWATNVASILNDVFKEDEESGRRRYSPFFFDYEYGNQDTEKPRARLSKRKPLRIIADSDTNSILVQGGDPAQLRKIEDLIKMYDRPQPTDAKSVRKTEMISLRYAKAKTVSDTVKDVYRDLLSSNDKALAGAHPDRPERFIRLVFEDEEKRQPTYKGLLSIGVDEVSNTLIVSAPAYLLEEISKMIKDLDEAARPVADSVSVVKIGPGLSAAQIEAAVGKAFGDSTSSSSDRARRNGMPWPSWQSNRFGDRRHGPSEHSGDRPSSNYSGERRRD